MDKPLFYHFENLEQVMLLQHRGGDLSSQEIPNTNNDDIGSCHKKGYPVLSEDFPEVISLRQIGEQFTADTEDDSQDM